MKKAGKMAVVGVVLGVLELGIAVLLANVWKVGAFEDAAFLLGLVTLIIGLFALFGVSRLRTGVSASPFNANAQAAVASQTAFEEQRTLEKISSAARARLAGLAVESILFFAAAAVVFAGFGVSLLF